MLAFCCLPTQPRGLIVLTYKVIIWAGGDIKDKIFQEFETVIPKNPALCQVCDVAMKHKGRKSEQLWSSLRMKTVEHILIRLIRW